MKTLIFLSIVFVLTLSCDKSRQAIKYGEDQCDFCSMGIVQKTHAAQLVTQKGKQRKFDAIECMVNFVKQDAKKMTDASLFVANYNQPGEMIDAKTATYLISKNLPSPMGAYLTAFATVEDAKKAQDKLDGKLHTWDELSNVINKDIHQHH